MRTGALGWWIAKVACLSAVPLAAAAGGTQDAEVIVLGGKGKTAQGAQETLALWNEQRAAIASVLAPASGFPRIVTAADVPELEPGVHAVAVGFCPPERARIVEKSFSGMWPRAWSTSVRRPGGPLPCPEPVGGWSFGARLSVVMPEGTLSASSFLQAGSAPGAKPELVLVHLRLPDERLSDWKEISIPAGCTVAFKKEPGVLRVERDCPGAPEQAGAQRFAIRDGKIAQAAGLAEMADAQAVVFTRSAKPGDAEAALARWERERAAIADALSLPAGYPRAVSAANLPGVAPSGGAVVLGVCPASRLGDALKTLQAFDPSIQAVKVAPRSGDPACPEIVKQWKVNHAERVRAGQATLTVVEFIQPGSLKPWMARAFLRDAKGALLDWKGIDMQSVSHDGSGSCLGIELVPRKQAISLELDCGAPGTDDPNPQSWTQRLTYSVRGGKIVAEEAEP